MHSVAVFLLVAGAVAVTAVCRRRGWPAPLVLVTTPATGQPFGSHAAIAADGQRLLAADLSRRLGRLGAAVGTGLALLGRRRSVAA